MKKILNLLTISILTSSSISSVISCDNNKNPYNSVTKDQEIYALNNFIQKNKSKLDPGFKFYDSSDNTDSIFNNHKEKNNIQIIDWTVNSSQNSKKDNMHSMLKASYSGIMKYNLKTKNFILDGDLFNNVEYIPGNFNPSLGIPSMISGNTNDFTIAVSSGKLTDFVDLIAPGGFAKGIGDVFKNMEWHNSKNFPKLTLPNLKSIYQEYNFWNIPPGYMAIIHVKKTKNKFQIVWSNLNSPTEKKSLVEYGIHGYLTNTFWKKTNSQNHLWISKSLLTMIYQLKSNNLNQFLNNSASFFSWLNPVESISEINQHGYKPGIQIAKNTTQTQKQYNTSQTELWDGINNLLTNWSVNQNIIKGLLIAKPILPPNWQGKNKDYQAYDLVFDKSNNKWTFNKDNSKGMEQTI